MDQQKNAEGLAWQISVWDRMVPVYVREIDKRFGPIVEHVVKRADLKPGEHVPNGDGPRRFRDDAHFSVGHRIRIECASDWSRVEKNAS